MEFARLARLKGRSKSPHRSSPFPSLSQTDGRRRGANRKMDQEKNEGVRSSVRIVQSFDASPETVFDAWIDPEVSSKWLFATRSGRTESRLDPREGGSYTITRREGGQRYLAVGEYLEVKRPSRLAFTFGMPQFSDEFATVEVDIAASRGATRLWVTQSQVQEDYAQATMAGWCEMLELLSELIE